MPINFIIMGGSRSGYKEAIHLIKNINAKLVFADHTYDTNEILSYINKQNIKLVIPQKRIAFTSVIIKVLRF